MRIFLMGSVVETASHSRMMEPLLALRFFTPVGLPFLEEEEVKEELEDDETETDEDELDEETTLAR